MGLLQRDHRARASGVADVHPLDRRLEPELSHQVRVEARAEPAGARRGGDEVEVAGRPSRAAEHAPQRLRPDLDGAAAEAVVELVHASRRGERGRVEVEIPALDVAVREEARAGAVVARHAEQRRLIPAKRRRGGGARDDAGRAHARSIRSAPCLVHAKRGNIGRPVEQSRTPRSRRCRCYSLRRQVPARPPHRVRRAHRDHRRRRHRRGERLGLVQRRRPRPTSRRSSSGEAPTCRTAR